MAVRRSTNRPLRSRERLGLFELRGGRGDCAEFIKYEAIVCKHCGSDLVSSKDTIDDFIKQAGKS
jgi:hypothetical protein